MSSNDVWKSTTWKTTAVAVDWTKKKWTNNRDQNFLMCKYKHKSWVQINRLEVVTSATLESWYNIYKNNKKTATTQQFKKRHVLLAKPFAGNNSTVVISLQYLTKYIKPMDEYKNKKNYKMFFSNLQKEEKRANKAEAKAKDKNREESDEKDDDHVEIEDPHNIKIMTCILQKNALQMRNCNFRGQKLRVREIGVDEINKCLKTLGMNTQTKKHYRKILQNCYVISKQYANNHTLCVATVYKDESDEYLECFKITNRDELDAFNAHCKLVEESDFAGLCHVEIRDINPYRDCYISYNSDLYPGTVADLIDQFDELESNSNSNTTTNRCNERKNCALFMGFQMCVALMDMQGRGYLHRDIKPENIIFCITSEGEFLLKLIDFGFLKSVNLKMDNLSMSVCGTSGYHGFNKKQWNKDKAKMNPNVVDSMGLVMTILEIGCTRDIFSAIQKYLMKHKNLSRQRIANILHDDEDGVFIDIAMEARSPVLSIFDLRYWDLKRYVRLCERTLSNDGYNRLCGNMLFRNILARSR